MFKRIEATLDDDQYYKSITKDKAPEKSRAVRKRIARIRPPLDSKHYADEIDIIIVAKTFNIAFIVFYDTGAQIRIDHYGDIENMDDVTVPCIRVQQSQTSYRRIVETRSGINFVYEYSSPDRRSTKPRHFRAGGRPETQNSVETAMPTLTRKASAPVMQAEPCAPPTPVPSPSPARSSVSPVPTVSRSRGVVRVSTPPVPQESQDIFIPAQLGPRIEEFIANARVNVQQSESFRRWVPGSQCAWDNCASTITGPCPRSHIMTHIKAQLGTQADYARNVTSFLTGTNTMICTGPSSATLFNCSRVATAHCSFMAKTASLAEDEAPSFKNFFFTCSACRSADVENVARTASDDVARLAGLPVRPIVIDPELIADATIPLFAPPDRCTDERWVIEEDKIIDERLIAIASVLPRGGRKVIHPDNEVLYYNQLLPIINAATQSVPGATIALYVYTLVMSLTMTRSTAAEESVILAHWVKRDFRAFTACLFRPREQRAPRATGDQQLQAPDSLPAAAVRKIKSTLRDQGSGRAAAIIDRPGIAPHTPELADLVRELHPYARPPDVPQPAIKPKPDEMSLEQLHRTVHEISPSSADGFGALSVHVLRRMTTDPRHRPCALAFLALLNNIIAGSIRPRALHLHLISTMIPALKKDGEVSSAKDLRPICVLSTIIKISAKFLADKYRAKFGDVLGPRQLGAGAPGGIDIMGHSVQTIMAWAYKNKTPMVVVNLDGTNAFGLCSRAAAIAQFLEHAPGAFAYIASVYGQANTAYMNGERILIHQGARQGDPLSTYFYALSINEVLQQLAAEFPSALILNYVDDLVCIASPTETYRFIARFHELAAPVGYHINIRKTVLAVNPAAPADQATHRAGITMLCDLLDQPQGIACVKTDADGDLVFPSGLTVTGIPCFFHDPLHPNDDAIAVISQRITTATQKLAKVGSIKERQVTVAILREARNIGLVGHLLRTIHPAIWTSRDINILDSFDDTAFKLLAQQILGDLHGQDTTLLAADICAIAAPIKKSGTAFRKASAIAACAWLSSVQRFFPAILDIVRSITGNDQVTRLEIERLATDARAMYKTKILRPNELRIPLPDFTFYIPPNPDVNSDEFKALRTLQARLSAHVDAANAAGRYGDLEIPHDVTKAQLERRAESSRASFLFSIAGRNGGIDLSNNEVTAILQLHLGLERRFAFRRENILWACPTYTVASHSLASCRYITTFRHNEANDAIGDAIREAGIHGRIDVNMAHLFPIVNLNPRHPGERTLLPGDIIVNNYRGTGRPWLLDVTIIDTLAAGNNTGSIHEVLRQHHIAKHRKYDLSCRHHGITFHPLVFTHLGVIHKTSSVILSILLGITKPEPDIPPSQDQLRRMLIKRNLLNKIACIAAKHCARSLIRHAPPAVPVQNNP